MSILLKKISNLTKQRNIKEILLLPQNVLSHFPQFWTAGWAVINGPPPFYWENAERTTDDGLAFWFVLSGHVTLESCGTVVEGAPGTLMIRPSGHRETIISNEAEFEHVFFLFRGPGIQQPKIRETTDGQLLKQLIFYLQQETHQDDIAIGMLSKIIAENMLDAPSPNPLESLLKNLKPNEFPDIGEVAQLLGMSRSNLYRHCMEWYGRPPFDLLMERRMKRAQALLTGTGEKLSVIASLLGYSSAFAFNKAYNHYFGHRPGLNRKKKQ